MQPSPVQDVHSQGISQQLCSGKSKHFQLTYSFPLSNFSCPFADTQSNAQPALPMAPSVGSTQSSSLHVLLTVEPLLNTVHKVQTYVPRFQTQHKSPFFAMQFSTRSMPHQARSIPENFKEVEELHFSRRVSAAAPYLPCLLMGSLCHSTTSHITIFRSGDSWWLLSSVKHACKLPP